MRGLALCVGLLAATATVAAQETPDEQARAHFKRGRAAYDEGRYDTALRDFEEALRLSQRPALLYNIGRCHEQLGHAAAAIDAYERYLVAAPDATDRLEAKERIDRLRARAAEPTRPPAPVLAPPAPTVAPVSVVAPAPEVTRKPIYRRAWFWGVIGGVAAVAITGVVVGVVVGGGGGGPRTLNDVTGR
jgi:tetratricopeptide (TPR) repeat protein